MRWSWCWTRVNSSAADYRLAEFYQPKSFAWLTKKLCQSRYRILPPRCGSVSEATWMNNEQWEWGGGREISLRFNPCRRFVLVCTAFLVQRMSFHSMSIHGLSVRYCEGRPLISMIETCFTMSRRFVPWTGWWISATRRCFGRGCWSRVKSRICNSNATRLSRRETTRPMAISTLTGLFATPSVNEYSCRSMYFLVSGCYVPCSRFQVATFYADAEDCWLPLLPFFLRFCVAVRKENFPSNLFDRRGRNQSPEKKISRSTSEGLQAIENKVRFIISSSLLCKYHALDFSLPQASASPDYSKKVK